MWRHRFSRAGALGAAGCSRARVGLFWDAEGKIDTIDRSRARDRLSGKTCWQDFHKMRKPEVRYDKSCDIWSCGVIMYTMQLAMQLVLGCACCTSLVAQSTHQEYVQVHLQGLAFCDLCLVANAISNCRNYELQFRFCQTESFVLTFRAGSVGYAGYALQSFLQG